MPSDNLPKNLDTDRLAEAVLAILSLTLHDDNRVWKGIDWDVLDLLHEKGWVVDPHTRAKSVLDPLLDVERHCCPASPSTAAHAKLTDAESGFDSQIGSGVDE